MWLYKKAKNLTIEEKTRLVENLNKYGYRTFVKNTSREDFIKDQVERHIKELEQLDKIGTPHDEWEYEFVKEYSDPIKVGEWYDESVELNRLREETYKAFKEDPNSIDIIEIYKIFDKGDSALVKYYNGEWYVHTIFDTYFRCYSYGDEEIDNYENMIKYLKPLAPTMIKQYGTFDENGKFSYYNNETYEGKDGLTDELKEMLKFLYKDNDIFIEFA